VLHGGYIVATDRWRVYCDPYFPVAHHTRKHDLGLRSVSLSADTFAGYDALVVSTAHELFKDPALYRG